MDNQKGTGKTRLYQKYLNRLAFQSKKKRWNSQKRKKKGGEGKGRGALIREQERVAV